MNPSEKNWELEQELGLWGKVARFSKKFFKWYWKKIQQRLIFFKKNNSQLNLSFRKTMHNIWAKEEEKVHLNFVYLKFKINWASYVLSGSPILGTLHAPRLAGSRYMPWSVPGVPHVFSPLPLAPSQRFYHWRKTSLRMLGNLWAIPQNIYIQKLASEDIHILPDPPTDSRLSPLVSV